MALLDSYVVTYQLISQLSRSRTCPLPY